MEVLFLVIWMIIIEIFIKFYLAFNFTIFYGAGTKFSEQEKCSEIDIEM